MRTMQVSTVTIGIACVVAVAWAGSTATRPAPRSSLLSDAAGEWVVDSWSGKASEGQVFVAAVGRPVEISHDHMSWVESWGVDDQGKRNWFRVARLLVVRPDVSPVAVDLTADDPRYKAWSRVGILEVKGDELHLCVNFHNGPRPTTFDGGDDGSELVTLRRVKPAGG